MSITEVELDRPPAFEMGQKVRLRKLIRNDGTFPGREVGEVLAKKGETGYVAGIGTYLQRSYVYSIHLLERGLVVGCLKRELDLVEDEDEEGAEHESDVTAGV